MMPPIFEILEADTSVQSFLSGAEGLRLYSFGNAPQDVVKPYAVWQLAYGQPENYLGDLPDTDSLGVQVDVYATSRISARNVGIAITNALEPFAYVTSWLGEMRDPVTKNFRFGFTVDFIEYR